jgi:hypothetical protein
VEKTSQQLSGQMIFKLNSVLGSGGRHVYRISRGRRTVTDERAKQQKHYLDEQRGNALEEVTAKMRRSADAIKDDHLRYQFLLAAGSCLARKKNLMKRTNSGKLMNNEK